MTDSSELIMTLAQVGGGFVAIISGFIFSKVLTLSGELRVINRKSREIFREQTKELNRLGVTAYDIYKGYKKDELKQVREITDEPLSELFHEEMTVKDPSIIIRAFLSLVPMVIFGVVVPLVYLAAGRTLINDNELAFLLSGFLLGMLSILGFIAWYAWRVYSEW